MPNKPPSKKSSAPAEADARRWLHELEKQNAQLRSTRDEAEVLLEQLRISGIRCRRISSSNLKLKHEVSRRQKVEKVLQQTEQRQGRLLEQARRQQQKMRDFSHQILHAQEEERKRISRELHDVIAQTLVGINMHLAALTHDSPDTPRSFQQKIARTRRLVEKSVDIVHKFACELRPILLDNLGLIPALQVFLRNFIEDTGIRVSLKTFAGIEQAPEAVRIVLYRVAQEALNNVARHARASHVEVVIRDSKSVICMEIKDNGQGFDVAGAACVKPDTRLGLLGMRERVEMIGGRFRVESAPGQHTTVRVELPIRKRRHKPSR